MDMKITRVEDRDVGGTWAFGNIANYEFCALVFPAHAISHFFELKRSKISKLWIKQKGGNVVFNFDRGMDIEAKNQEVKSVVTLLCKNLAKSVFPKLKHREV